MKEVYGAPETQKEKLYKFFVNGVKYEVLNPSITGSELKQIAELSTDETLCLVNQNTDDIIIENTEVINLSLTGVKHFETKPRSKVYKILVNAREKNWQGDLISFEQIVELAFGAFDNSINIVYTVAYDKGPKENRSGVFVKSQSVNITNNMVFNATRTDKS